MPSLKYFYISTNSKARNLRQLILRGGVDASNRINDYVSTDHLGISFPPFLPTFLPTCYSQRCIDL